MPTRPELSVVVVVYDMAREAPRTLHSLRRDYQRGVDDLRYEVIVVDNGSPQPLAEEVVAGCGAAFRLIRIADASPSPCAAINAAVAASSGEMVAVHIDGARILSPGLLALAMRAGRLHPDPVIATLGWHLGPGVQARTVGAGYSRAAEDDLLAGVGWPGDGYRLFSVSSFAGSSRAGWFRPPAESNCLFLRRDTFDRVGGYEEAFRSPGGGLANLDFFRRVVDDPATSLVVLLGEGTFHQLHGGATTGDDGTAPAFRYRDFLPEYEAIRGETWRAPATSFELYGPVTEESLPFLAESLRAVDAAK